MKTAKFTKKFKLQTFLRFLIWNAYSKFNQLNGDTVEEKLDKFRNLTALPLRKFFGVSSKTLSMLTRVGNQYCLGIFIQAIVAKYGQKACIYKRTHTTHYKSGKKFTLQTAIILSEKFLIEHCRVQLPNLQQKDFFPDEYQLKYLRKVLDKAKKPKAQPKTDEENDDIEEQKLETQFVERPFERHAKESEKSRKDKIYQKVKDAVYVQNIIGATTANKLFKIAGIRAQFNYDIQQQTLQKNAARRAQLLDNLCDELTGPGWNIDNVHIKWLQSQANLAYSMSRSL